MTNLSYYVLPSECCTDLEPPAVSQHCVNLRICFHCFRQIYSSANGSKRCSWTMMCIWKRMLTEKHLNKYICTRFS